MAELPQKRFSSRQATMLRCCIYIKTHNQIAADTQKQKYHVHPIFSQRSKQNASDGNTSGWCVNCVGCYHPFHTLICSSR